MYLGAVQKQSSIYHVEQMHSENPAFLHFRSRFEKSLNEILSRIDSPVQLQNAQGLSVPADAFVCCNHPCSWQSANKFMHQITEHQFIKATFESLADWWAHTDLLRCNPLFWKGKGWFDCVFIDAGSQPYFAKLLFFFTYQVKASEDAVIPSGEAEVTIPMALIQLFKKITPARKRTKILACIACKKHHQQKLFLSLLGHSYMVHILFQRTSQKNSHWL